MRPIVLILAVLALSLVPAGLATPETQGGNGAGAEVLGYSTGTWDIWRVHVTSAGTLSASLTWVTSPGGADYDMTLWKPGADLDGLLAQSEILATSWRIRNTPGESFTFPVTPNPATQKYVITVEPIMAKLETYYLTVDGGDLIRTCHPTAAQATFNSVCLGGATGSTKFRP